MREVGDRVWASHAGTREGGMQEDGERSCLASSQLIDDDENGNKEEKPNPTEGM